MAIGYPVMWLHLSPFSINLLERKKKPQHNTRLLLIDAFVCELHRRVSGAVRAGKLLLPVNDLLVDLIPYFIIMETYSHDGDFPARGKALILDLNDNVFFSTC